MSTKVNENILVRNRTVLYPLAQTNCKICKIKTECYETWLNQSIYKNWSNMILFPDAQFLYNASLKTLGALHI